MNSDGLRDTSNLSKDPDFLNKRGALILGGLKLAIEIKRNLKSMILLN
jgi:hypothetical protein